MTFPTECPIHHCPLDSGWCCAKCEDEDDPCIGEPISVPSVGDWVVFTHSNHRDERVYVKTPTRFIMYGSIGIVLDYIAGGPEYPPCIIVAWSVDGWWYPSKHLPEDLSHYVVGR